MFFMKNKTYTIENSLYRYIVNILYSLFFKLCCGNCFSIPTTIIFFDIKI